MSRREVVNAPGVLAPAGTPKPIIEKLRAGLLPVLELPDMRERMSGPGFERVGGTPDEFIRSDPREHSEAREAAEGCRHQAGMSIRADCALTNP